MAASGSILSGVAGRYAAALFDLAVEAKSIDVVARDLARFEALVAGSDDLASLIKSPVFTADEQVSAISAVLDRAKIGGLAANFIKLVASKRRMFVLPGMIAGYRALVADDRGVTSAEVTLADPASDVRLAEIRAALEGAAGGKVDLSVRIDPAIIGGVIVKMGSRMIDASLRAKLTAIRTRMKEVG
jgi:F-type H+-transporting ATPase subunit delta